MEFIDTYNMDFVREFMLDDEIWDYVAQDSATKESYIPECNKNKMWLTCLDREMIIGVISLTSDGHSAVKMHPCMMKECRNKSREMIKEFLKWFCLFMPNHIQKLNVCIPFSRKIVYNLAKKCGFIDEGINRKSFLKNGQWYDQWYLGLTRSEIEGML